MRAADELRDQADLTVGVLSGIGRCSTVKSVEQFAGLHKTLRTGIEIKTEFQPSKPGVSRFDIGFLKDRERFRTGGGKRKIHVFETEVNAVRAR